MAELQLTNADLAGIAGTGSGNRVTIKDLENYLRQIGIADHERCLRHPHGRRGCDATQLDAATGDGRVVGESRSCSERIVNSAIRSLVRRFMLCARSRSRSRKIPPRPRN